MSSTLAPILRFYRSSRYATYSCAYIVLFAILVFLGINFSNAVASGVAAYFSRISRWLDVYLMAFVGLLLMLAFFMVLAIAMGRWNMFQELVSGDSLFLIKSGVFHFLSMAVANAVALYVWAFLGRKT